MGGNTMETAQSLDAQRILRSCIYSRLYKSLIYIRDYSGCAINPFCVYYTPTLANREENGSQIQRSRFTQYQKVL